MERFVAPGDLCVIVSRLISLCALGVGLDERGTRVVLEVKAELSAEGIWCSLRLTLIDESSRLVTGRKG